MTYRDDLRAEPYGFDFFSTMRELERSSRDKPRIGENNVLAEEIVSLGQDPFLEFPASNLTGYEDRPEGTPRRSGRVSWAITARKERCRSARQWMRIIGRRSATLPSFISPTFSSIASCSSSSAHGRTHARSRRPTARTRIASSVSSARSRGPGPTPSSGATAGGHRQGLVRRHDRLADQERRHGSSN